MEDLTNKNIEVDGSQKPSRSSMTDVSSEDALLLPAGPGQERLTGTILVVPEIAVTCVSPTIDADDQRVVGISPTDIVVSNGDTKVTLRASAGSVSERSPTVFECNSDCSAADYHSVSSVLSGLESVSGALAKATLEESRGFVRLSSSQRAHFKREMAKGQSRERALEIALTHKPQAGKRQRSIEGVASQPSKKPKTVESGTPKPTYSQVAGRQNVGFVSSSSADGPLSNEQLARLREIIFDVVVEGANDNKVHPRFTEGRARSGWLLLGCQDQATVAWLQSNTELFQSKCGFGIRLVEEQDFPRAEIVRGFFPESAGYENKKVLNAIMAQNPRLITSQWKVIGRLVHDKMLHLVMLVDDVSMVRLKECGFQIAYKFGVVKLKPKASTATDNASSGKNKSVLADLPSTSSGKGSQSQSVAPKRAAPPPKSCVGTISRPGPSIGGGKVSSAIPVPGTKDGPRSKAAPALTRTVVSARGTVRGKPPNSVSRSVLNGNGSAKKGKGPRQAQAAKLVSKSLKKGES